MILGIVVALAGCWSRPAPSCIEAVGHLNAAGCLGLFDVEQEVLDRDTAHACEVFTKTFVPACEDELDAWFRCINEVRANEHCHSCDEWWYGGLGGCYSRRDGVPYEVSDHATARP